MDVTAWYDSQYSHTALALAEYQVTNSMRVPKVENQHANQPCTDCLSSWCRLIITNPG